MMYFWTWNSLDGAYNLWERDMDSNTVSIVFALPQNHVPQGDPCMIGEK